MSKSTCSGGLTYEKLTKAFLPQTSKNALVNDFIRNQKQLAHVYTSEGKSAHSKWLAGFESKDPLLKEDKAELIDKARSKGGVADSSPLQPRRTIPIEKVCINRQNPAKATVSPPVPNTANEKDIKEPYRMVEKRKEKREEKNANEISDNGSVTKARKSPTKQSTGGHAKNSCISSILTKQGQTRVAKRKRPGSDDEREQCSLCLNWC